MVYSQTFSLTVVSVVRLYTFHFPFLHWSMLFPRLLRFQYFFFQSKYSRPFLLFFVSPAFWTSWFCFLRYSCSPCHFLWPDFSCPGSPLILFSVCFSWIQWRLCPSNWPLSVRAWVSQWVSLRLSESVPHRAMYLQMHMMSSAHTRAVTRVSCFHFFFPSSEMTATFTFGTLLLVSSFFLLLFIYFVSCYLIVCCCKYLVFTPRLPR